MRATSTTAIGDRDQGARVATSRTQAETMRCPRCHVAPGERCLGYRGKPREAAHRERHQFYARTHRV